MKIEQSIYNWNLKFRKNKTFYRQSEKSLAVSVICVLSTRGAGCAPYNFVVNRSIAQWCS